MGSMTLYGNQTNTVSAVPPASYNATVEGVKGQSTQSSGGGVPLWGTIQGDLFQQTDLMNALDTKADEVDLLGHVNDTNNPHHTDAADVGLDQVANLNPAQLGVVIAPIVGPLISVTSSQISDSTPSGRNVLAGTAAAGRTALGATAFGSSMFTAANATAGAALLTYGGRLLRISVLAGSGSFNPLAATVSVLFEICGAGGGSGGSPPSVAGQYSVGQAGGHGGFGRHFAAVVAGAPYVVGAGGTAGAVNGAGGAGGSSTFMGVTAGGGAAGAPFGPSAANIVGPGTPGGCAGANILNVIGPAGDPCAWSYFSQLPMFGPAGVSGPYGSGAPARGGTGNAPFGSGFGVGGGWCMSLPSGVGWAGAAGMPGTIIVYEFS